MKEAASDLLVFVVYDYVLDTNYLSEVFQIKDEWPRLGVWRGGAIVPEFELQAPEQVKRFTGYLALREVPKARWSNLVFAEMKPLGAGFSCELNSRYAE